MPNEDSGIVVHGHIDLDAAAGHSAVFHEPVALVPVTPRVEGCREQPPISHFHNAGTVETGESALYLWNGHICIPKLHFDLSQVTHFFSNVYLLTYCSCR